MKNKLAYFLAGAAAAAGLCLFPATALAAGGFLNITVDPIRILINGDEFCPLDADGNELPLFAYSGTAYVPLRAFAETCGGIEVGYDTESNCVTVVSPDTAAGLSSDFMQQWTISEKPVTNYGNERIFTAAYSGDLSLGDFKDWWKALNDEDISAGAEALVSELQAQFPGSCVNLYFSYGSYNLGSAYAVDHWCSASFKAADSWIK